MFLFLTHKEYKLYFSALGGLIHGLQSKHNTIRAPSYNPSYWFPRRPNRNGSEFLSGQGRDTTLPLQQQYRFIYTSRQPNITAKLAVIPRKHHFYFRV